MYKFSYQIFDNFKIRKTTQQAIKNILLSTEPQFIAILIIQFCII